MPSTRPTLAFTRLVRTTVFLTAVLLAARAPSARAQDADALRAGVGRHWPDLRGAAAQPFAPIASALLPGSGQFMQRRERSILYLAVEGVGWWKLIRDVGERARQETEFKSLARTVARAHFSPGGPDGDWTYYEAMRDHRESGRYSLSTAGLVPETDTATFNGYTWYVITGTMDTVANMAGALAQYEQRAYKSSMLWSWGNAGLQFDLFKRSTERRNDADAAVKSDIAVIALNHLVSMVDAFAMFRLDAQQLPDGRTAIGAKVRW